VASTNRVSHSYVDQSSAKVTTVTRTIDHSVELPPSAAIFFSVISNRFASISSNTTKKYEHVFHHCLVIVFQGDVCDETTNAIINCANTRLDHGSGVAEAIRLAGAPVIVKDSNVYIETNGSLDVGQAVLMCAAGKLKCTHIIHACGPIFDSKNPKKSEQLFVNTVFNILKVAIDSNLVSLSIPALSSGIYMFPVKKCAQLMIGTIVNFLDLHCSTNTLTHIHLINIDAPTAQVFENELKIVAGKHK
jgi:putative ATPase